MLDSLWLEVCRLMVARVFYAAMVLLNCRLLNVFRSTKGFMVEFFLSQ